MGLVSSVLIWQKEWEKQGSASCSWLCPLLTNIALSRVDLWTCRINCLRRRHCVLFVPSFTKNCLWNALNHTGWFRAQICLFLVLGFSVCCHMATEAGSQMTRASSHVCRLLHHLLCKGLLKDKQSKTLETLSCYARGSPERVSGRAVGEGLFRSLGHCGSVP